ncbi:RNA 3'-terminal phosphate cyclase [uncultured archaeon]|nr:RNA 3'-terminal phosphate cyclase [uncultured archaeon]
MISIDGSHHEGGGQIIRTAVALSALTGKAVKIEKIRAGRPNPGLQAQHIAAVEAVAKLCNAEVNGLAIGSQVLEFKPGKITAENILIKIPTAGSIGLVLQALLIPAAFADKPLEIRIEGGATFGKWAPPVQYLEKVISPVLACAGYSFKINILRHGFYPVGGAIVEVRTMPAKLKAIKLEKRGEIKQISGISIASTHLKGARVAERQKEAAISALENLADIKTEYVEASCPGSGIVLWASDGDVVLGADALGERGKSAESVGEEAAKKLKKQIDSGACLDEWMADQIVPYLALAGGSVKVAEITPHVETNIWVVEQFLGKKFKVDKEKRIIEAKNV